MRPCVDANQEVGRVHVQMLTATPDPDPPPPSEDEMAAFMPMIELAESADLPDRRTATLG